MIINLNPVIMFSYRYILLAVGVYCPVAHALVVLLHGEVVLVGEVGDLDIANVVELCSCRHVPVWFFHMLGFAMDDICLQCRAVPDGTAKLVAVHCFVGLVQVELQVVFKQVH